MTGSGVRIPLAAPFFQKSMARDRLSSLPRWHATILQDVANTLPHMIMGERMPYADLEVLAELPDGKLSIDLLTREARHSSAAPVALEIVDHLAEWLGERLASHRQATA